VLDVLFHLLHPIMPFITEELWTTLTGKRTLVTSAWPEVDKKYLDKKSEKLIGELQKIVTEVRRFRNDQGVKPSQKIPARFIAPNDVMAYQSAMAFLLKLELVELTPSASVEIGDMKVELDLSGTVDVVAERARLEKDLITAQKDLKTAEVKLNNEGFMAKAPANVVAEIKERLAVTTADIERITAQLAALK
jgi:valyl-tRNA synthetase